MTSATEKNGGAAFPRTLPDCPVPPDRALAMIAEYSGMSLRDWFAGQALAGLCESGVKADYDGAHIAAACWRLAGAMLAERERIGVALEDSTPEKRG